MAQTELPRGDTAEDTERGSGITSRPRPRSELRLPALLRGFLPRPRSGVDAVRRLVVPLILALVPFFWIADATLRSSLTTIGRDQGIFQYIAWAVRRGEIDYRDIRDVNGPLIHLVHSAILALGGADEHRFHIVELAATGISFAIVGACLPGIVTKRSPTWLERVGWAFAGWVVLGAQYHLYLYWNQAQRESFCDWFLLPSLALQIMRPATTTRGAQLRVIAIAALSSITWLGKLSFAPFAVAQLAVLLFDRDLPVGRRARFGLFVLGGALGLLVPFAWLCAHGDPIAFAKITFGDVPRVYRFIWAKSAQEILGDDGPLVTVSTGLAASALLTALVVLRKLPRRMLALAFAPLAALASVIAQHKGFGYHFHPLTATTHMIFMVIVLFLWETFRAAPRTRSVGRYVVLGLTAAYALEIASSMKASPHTRNVWLLAGGETAERRMQQEYFDSFKSYDFFPWEMRLGARYLADKTSGNARVQIYGMDPYILFLAERRSATPYIYAYDLNADAALDGGWSNRPTELDKRHILDARDAHEADMLARLRASPPEAFVFIDRAPLISYPDAWEDFRHCCAKAATWVATNYHPAKSFGEVVHVWLRDDLPVPDAEGLP